MRLDVATRTINGIALCAGVGTIELGLRLVYGTRYRTVGYVERETFAASVLVARMAEQAMDTAPIWDDLSTFHGQPWRGRVDIVTAGFPCQPFSQAGKRAGTNDERWLWPHVHRIVDEIQPTLVFLENVPPIVKHGLDEILDGLAASGFDAEWGCLSAADVGATHIRKRLWLLAYRDSARLAGVRFAPQLERHLAHRQSSAHVADPGGTRRQPLAGREPPAQGVAPGRTTHTSDVAERPRQDVADTESDHRRTRLREGTAGDHLEPLDIAEPGDSERLLADPERPRPQGGVHRLPERQRRPAVGGDQVADPDSLGRAGGSAQRAHERWPRPTHRRGGFPLWPPRPDDELGWLNPTLPQPSVCRTSDGLANRLDRLHAIGNGVVPLVAAVAFVRLAQRAGLVERGEVTP